MISPRLARTYFGIQAVAFATWWVVLAVRAPARSLFRAAGAPDSTLLAFAPGDLLLTLGSAVVALGADGRRRCPGPLAWLVAGATAYGAMYTLALALGGAAAPLGAVLMTPAALASLVCARALDHGEPDAFPGRGAR